jgi:predicted secreted protein
MAKRLALVGVLFLLAALAVFAGDVAQFVNLGFSPDSKYFMFGQYGISQKGSLPWADAAIVDVAANAFAVKGTRTYTGTRQADPGASGLGALLNALADLQPLASKLKVDHVVNGRLVYILLDGTQPPDAVEFRDFQAGRAYKIALTQSASAGATVSSSFVIAVTITEKSGAVRSVSAGNFSFRRPGVKAYHITQIILAPDGASLVFVVRKEEQDTQGDNIRYMVETVRVK